MEGQLLPVTGKAENLLLLHRAGEQGAGGKTKVPHFFFPLRLSVLGSFLLVHLSITRLCIYCGARACSYHTFTPSAVLSPLIRPCAPDSCSLPTAKTLIPFFFPFLYLFPFLFLHLLFLFSFEKDLPTSCYLSFILLFIHILGFS